MVIMMGFHRCNKFLKKKEVITMTDKSFSFASFVAYGNSCINNTTGKTPEIQNAFKSDLKKAIAHAGYPNKDEIGIIDEINDFEMNATLQTVPQLVSGYMRDEKRGFDIPAADSNTCAASIKVISVGEKTKEGINQLGPNAGQPYKSVTAAHDELQVKNRRGPFKK